MRPKNIRLLVQHKWDTLINKVYNLPANSYIFVLFEITNTIRAVDFKALFRFCFSALILSDWRVELLTQGTSLMGTLQPVTLAIGSNRSL